MKRTGAMRADQRLLQEEDTDASTTDTTEAPGRRSVSWSAFPPHFGITSLFAFTVFCSAFLLFQVQLIIAKYILPWFGGTPATFTTCILFFQVLLLLGYLYAHFIGFSP